MAHLPKMVEAADEALPHLLRYAMEKNPVFYSHLTRVHMGKGKMFQRGAGKFLDVIHDGCKQNGYPDLAALCVRKDTGRPGHRYVLLEDWEAEIKRVYEFDWSKITSLTLNVSVTLGKKEEPIPNETYSVGPLGVKKH